ncbi:MAG: hypothetical protein QE263_04480 [Vampirovibrionales bacterium]|nr:hypothetical protein [Vampirovibrionales bacterium]
MSSVNNSYSNYSYDFNKVHESLDKNKDGYVNKSEIQVYQNRLANNNSNSGKKAKSFLVDLLNNFDRVNSLSDVTPIHYENTYILTGLEQNDPQDVARGITLLDFNRLAKGSDGQYDASGGNLRIEKLDFSTALSLSEFYRKYPPPP